MEYASGGNLLEYIRKRRPENVESRDYYNELTAKDLLSFALQSARGMAHLSHNRVSTRLLVVEVTSPPTHSSTVGYVIQNN